MPSEGRTPAAILCHAGLRVLSNNACISEASMLCHMQGSKVILLCAAGTIVQQGTHLHTAGLSAGSCAQNLLSPLHTQGLMDCTARP